MKHASAACALLLLLAFAARAEEAQTTHKEIGTIKGIAKLGSLTMTAKGNVLACDEGAKAIKVFDADGKALATWGLGFAPSAITIGSDKSIYVGGLGHLVKLDPKGNVLKAIDSKSGIIQKTKASGMTTMGKDLFVSYGTGWSLRSLGAIVRFSLDFEAPKVIGQGFRGCCQRLDLVARDNVLYVAENARFRVVKMDREGKILSNWGKRDREGLEGFGACCNPMNLCFGPDGSLYTAESGLGRVKRHAADGKFLGVVGYADTTRFTRASGLAATCSNIALGISPDGKRLYVQDLKKSLIHILEKKGS